MPGTGEAATLRPKQPKVKVTAEALQGGKLAQIGTVIETRFSASERKVYKNFAHNLVWFIKGTEAESARDPDAMQRLQKIRNIVFITQLLGVIDVLRNVKNLYLCAAKGRMLCLGSSRARLLYYLICCACSQRILSKVISTA